MVGVVSKFCIQTALVLNSFFLSPTCLKMFVTKKSSLFFSNIVPSYLVYHIFVPLTRLFLQCIRRLFFRVETISADSWATLNLDCVRSVFARLWVEAFHFLDLRSARRYYMICLPKGVLPQICKIEEKAFVGKNLYKHHNIIYRSPTHSRQSSDTARLLHADNGHC